ncbi:MAG TPA: hypothetical protein VIK80_07880 [Flavihumibacter sp.]
MKWAIKIIISIFLISFSGNVDCKSIRELRVGINHADCFLETNSPFSLAHRSDLSFEEYTPPSTDPGLELLFSEDNQEKQQKWISLKYAKVYPDISAIPSDFFATSSILQSPPSPVSSELPLIHTSKRLSLLQVYRI